MVFVDQQNIDMDTLRAHLAALGDEDLDFDSLTDEMKVISLKVYPLIILTSANFALIGKKKQ